MSAPLAHLYALALHALDAQERRVGELRGRLAPVLAATGVGATLLSGPAVLAALDGGLLPSAALVIAFAGLLVALGAAVRLLTSKVQLPETDSMLLARTLRARGALADEARYYTVMIRALAAHQRSVRRTIDHMERVFTVMVCGMLVGVCGLALAALVA